MKKLLRVFLYTALLLSVSGKRATAQVGHSDPMLEGTWLFYLTFPDELGVPPFQELLSMSRDGRALTSFTPASDAPQQPVRWGEYRPHRGHWDYTAYTTLTTPIESGLLRDSCTFTLLQPDTIDARCELYFMNGDGSEDFLTVFRAIGKRLPLLPIE